MQQRQAQPADAVPVAGATAAGATATCSGAHSQAQQQAGLAGAELRRLTGAGPQAKRRRERVTAADVHAHAARLGLTGPLGAHPEEGGGGNAFQEQLRQWAREEAAEAWDLPRFSTALEWLDDVRRRDREAATLCAGVRSRRDAGAAA